MLSIAIDGPSGAGKSTIAKRIADRFGFVYLDTGAIYRTVGLYAYRNNVTPSDENEMSALLPDIKIELVYDEKGTQKIFLNSEDVSSEIRLPLMSYYASRVSPIRPVRAFLLEIQREFARTKNVVMDGRDIGTVVLPEADVKIFLTALPEVRAQRRWLEIHKKGGIDSYEEVLSAITERDERDSSRAFAPLKQAEDAVLVDTSELTLEETVERISEIIEAALKVH